jgi:predicted small lipoprotein YifL
MRNLMIVLALSTLVACGPGKGQLDTGPTDTAPPDYGHASVWIEYGICEIAVGTSPDWIDFRHVEVLGGDQPEELVVPNDLSMQIICDHRSRPNYDAPRVSPGESGCLVISQQDDSYLLAYAFPEGHSSCN